MQNMTPEQLEHELELLQHGGAEAVSLFMRVAQEIFAEGGLELLDDWIILALPRLPEAEQVFILSLLIRTAIAANGTVQLQKYTVH